MFLILLLAFVPRFAAAEAKFDASRLVVNFGAFCQMRPVDEMPAPDTHASKIDLLPETPVIRWPTNVIPAMPGVSFGVRTEAPQGQVYYPVLIELTHPPFKNSGVTRQSYLTELGGEDPSINAYSFDLFEEMVHGRWTFRAYHNGETLYEVAFDVVDPALAPG
ncbi:MAG: DUF3859 domain-containing protein, partial [Arenibacterium sp.]